MRERCLRAGRPRSRGRRLLPLVACVALLPAAGRTQSPAPPPQAEKIGEDLYRVGKVTVDLKKRTAVCAGKVNMRKGAVEYLAVAPGGKVHESALSLNVRPLHLQVALILLGLEPKGGIERQGDTKQPQGSPVELRVSWKIRGKTTTVRAEELVWDIPKKRPMEPKGWVFSGSLVRNGAFLADDELSLVATFRDPAAIVNNALPGGADDTVYKANERLLPPVGTSITFTASAGGSVGVWEYGGMGVRHTHTPTHPHTHTAPRVVKRA